MTQYVAEISKTLAQRCRHPADGYHGNVAHTRSELMSEKYI